MKFFRSSNLKIVKKKLEILKKIVKKIINFIRDYYGYCWITTILMCNMKLNR